MQLNILYVGIPMIAGRLAWEHGVLTPCAGESDPIERVQAVRWLVRPAECFVEPEDESMPLRYRWNS
jgi:hypothetical protein